MKHLFVTVLVLPLWLGTAKAEDWSAFRGASGNGISPAKNVPTEWSAENNITWKVKVPGRSNGSPVMSGDRLYLTTASDDGRERRLHCFDANDGSEIWAMPATFDRKMPTHKTNLYAGTTPATDGKSVVVWHASAGLFCYDDEGNERWKRDLGEYQHQWGYGTSPVLHDGKVILHSGPGQQVFVGAFDLKTGDTIWQTDEPVENNGERNDDNQYMGSWSTPIVTKVDDRDIVVCSMSTRVNGYDLKTGELLWYSNGLRGPRGDLAYTSPVIADDICVAMGGFKGPAIGFRMGGSGDITDSDRLWRNDKGNPQRIGSGVVVDGLIYMANAGPNTIECIDPATGDSRWQNRGPDGAYWGSIVFADGKLYATDQNGTTIVFKPNPDKFELIATNRLNDPGNSTPAMADRAIFIRTFEHLYRIGVE